MNNGRLEGCEKSCKPNAMKLATIAEAPPIFMGKAHKNLWKLKIFILLLHIVRRKET